MSSKSVHPSDVSFVFRPIERWTGLDRVPKNGAFKVTPGRTQQDLKIELSRIGVDSCVIQADLDDSDIRIDGMPRANARYRSSRVIVSFTHPDQGAVAFPCGTYRDLWHNLRAIVLTMESLRAVNRYGVTQKSEQYTGWKTLPAGGVGGGDSIIPSSPSAGGFSTVDEAARFLIEASPAKATPSRVEDILSNSDYLTSVYRSASRRAHPDLIGSEGERIMIRINAARAMVLEHIERAGGSA